MSPPRPVISKAHRLAHPPLHPAAVSPRPRRDGQSDHSLRPRLRLTDLRCRAARLLRRAQPPPHRVHRSLRPPPRIPPLLPRARGSRGQRLPRALGLLVGRATDIGGDPRVGGGCSRKVHLRGHQPGQRRSRRSDDRLPRRVLPARPADWQNGMGSSPQRVFQREDAEAGPSSLHPAPWLCPPHRRTMDGASDGTRGRRSNAPPPPTVPTPVAASSAAARLRTLDPTASPRTPEKRRTTNPRIAARNKRAAHPPPSRPPSLARCLRRGLPSPPQGRA